MGKGLEKSKRIERIVLLIIILAIILYIIFDIKQDSKEALSEKYHTYTAEFNGEVKSIRRKNGSLIVTLNNKSEIYLLATYDNFENTPPSLYDYLKIGMSINKNNNSDTLFIGKRNSNKAAYFLLVK